MILVKYITMFVDSLQIDGSFGSRKGKWFNREATTECTLGGTTTLHHKYGVNHSALHIVGAQAYANKHIPVKCQAFTELIAQYEGADCQQR